MPAGLGARDRYGERDTTKAFWTIHCCEADLCRCAFFIIFVAFGLKPDCVFMDMTLTRKPHPRKLR